MKTNKIWLMTIVGIVLGAIVGLIVANIWFWLIIGALAGIVIGAIWKGAEKNRQTTM